MTFAEILPFLNEGFAVRRAEYRTSLIVFKQVSANIDDVTHVKSIPKKVKDIFLKFGVAIDYDFQYIVYDFDTGVGTHCIFDGEDINALDWELVREDYNPYA